MKKTYSVIIISVMVLIIILILFAVFSARSYIMLEFSINEPDSFDSFGWNLKVYPNINNYELTDPLYDYGAIWDYDFAFGTAYYLLKNCNIGDSYLIVASSSIDGVSLGPYYGIISDDSSCVLQSTGAYILDGQVMSESQ